MPSSAVGKKQPLQTRDSQPSGREHVRVQR